MDFKRVITGVVGFIIITVALLFCSTYLFDIIIALVALIMMDEYCKSFSPEKAKPIKWISYVSCLYIATMHIIPSEYTALVIGSLLILLILFLFLHIILSKMKINIVDISVTLFGIIYIVFSFSFIARLRAVEQGNILVWYVFLAAWGTDILAYVVGKYLGKHKFSKISPKKTIEGCIGGLAGAIVFVTVYTFVINKYFDMNINYWLIVLFGFIWSILGQIGDFSASSIKRYSDIKDFGNLLPGHGGMLDRLDSIIFVAPFTFLFLIIM